MKSGILRSGIAVVAAAGVLSGCLKSVDPPPPTPPRTYVSIMHLAPTAPSLDVFFNDTKVSNTPFVPGNVTVAYNAVDKGAFSIKLKKAASDSLVAEVPLAQYDSLNYYTIFIYNLQADGPARARRIKDDFSVLTLDKPYYRFFHASPNTGAVDLFLDNVKIENGRVHADNTTQEALNKFLGTTSGFHNMQVKLAATDTVITTLNNVSLLTGNAYTFYLKGLDGGSGTNQLSLEILRAVD